MAIVKPAPKPEPVDDVHPLPGENTRAVIGGNEPPLEDRIQMEFRDALLDTRPDFMVRYESAIDAVDRVKVDSDEVLGKAGDLDKILRACEAHIADTHKTVKAPYLAAGRAVDGEKNRLTDKVADARTRLKREMNTYAAKVEAERRAEAERIAAEQRRAAEAAARAERERQEAERAAAEAARNAKSDEERQAAADRAAEAARAAEEAMTTAALAPSAPVKAEPVRSDAGASVSTRTVWNSKVLDHAKAFKAVKGDTKVREAIEAAIARRVKAGDREIAGTEIWSTVEAIAR